jgi:hypothetical protein
VGYARNFLVAVAAAALVACGPSPSSGRDVASPSPLATELHREILKATNYDPDQVQLSLTSTQVVVTLTNSNLLAASHPDRDADAARIAHVVEKEIAARSELAGVHAIHIDYLARESGSSSMKDSMDYRKDAAGRFQKDVS